MPYVQYPGDVGRRDHDRERLTVRIDLGLEYPGVLPDLIPTGFNGLGVV
jgi:hypothetical protein